MSMSIQVRLQNVSEEFQKLQNDLSNTVEARQRLDAQLSENELVKKVPSFHEQLRRSSYYLVPQEFAQLTSENTVFKLVGPVLVKQDQTEAKNNVDTRLEFIRGEMFVHPSRSMKFTN